jgi:flagellar hook-associated protein 2
LTSANNEISLVLDGRESSVVSLAAKTYATGEELATEIQAKLNADPNLAGLGVSVAFTGGRLVFTSSSYGSASSVKLGAAPANSAFGILGLTGAASTAGVDVAGTINGESAEGVGQILTGNEGNATSDGLALLVALTPSEVKSGAEGVVTLIDGIAANVADRLNALTDPVDGRVTNRAKTITRKIEDLDAEVLRMEELMEERRLSLLADFARLEASLAQINSQGDFLIQQLSNLPRMDTLTRRNN